MSAGPETIVRPPAPYLPVGHAAEDVVDLGRVLRDECFTREFITGDVRPALYRRISAMAEAGDLVLVIDLVRAFLDSWPLAHLVDECRVAWTEGDVRGGTIATLARAARLISLARPEWSTSDDGLWPVPDEAWIRSRSKARSGAGPFVVVRRHDEDAADVVGNALDAVVDSRRQVDPELEFPAVLRIDGAELARRRREIGGALAAGKYVAVRITRAVPDDVESRLALGEVRLEGNAQRALERHGLPGLLDSDAPAWPDFVAGAAPGRRGPKLRSLAESILLPGPPEALARGEPSVVGYLFWDAPVRWIMVEPAAVEVLNALRKEPDPGRVASALDAGVEAVRGICDEIVRLGAATAL